MKKLLIYLAIIIAVIAIVVVAIHYLPVVYVITALVSFVLGAVAAQIWWKLKKEK